jgi:hypothetical protein
MRRKMKGTMIIIACICSVLLLTPACTAGLLQQKSTKKDKTSQIPSQSQYWGLLFAVGVYLNAPNMDRPEMLTSCDDLYNALLASSDYWKANNIHEVKGSQATLQNLIKELLWLRKNAKSEDYVVVYITTHGGQLKNAYGAPWDIPPKDETDGSDEVLMMYNGYDKWYGVIWDDALNFFLSIIKCKGLCLIVDSCYSGGFNDPPLNAFNPKNQGTFTAESFTKGFVKDLSAKNRIVLMSTEENCVSYGTFFSDFLINGFSGSGDSSGNHDGINSAEEAFSYAAPLTYWWVLFNTGQEQNPTISDNYPGEFPVTTS